MAFRDARYLRYYRLRSTTAVHNNYRSDHAPSEIGNTVCASHLVARLDANWACHIFISVLHFIHVIVCQRARLYYDGDRRKQRE